MSSSHSCGIRCINITILFLRDFLFPKSVLRKFFIDTSIEWKKPLKNNCLTPKTSSSCLDPFPPVGRDCQITINKWAAVKKESVPFLSFQEGLIVFQRFVLAWLLAQVTSRFPIKSACSLLVVDSPERFYLGLVLQPGQKVCSFMQKVNYFFFFLTKRNTYIFPSTVISSLCSSFFSNWWQNLNKQLEKNRTG